MEAKSHSTWHPGACEHPGYGVFVPPAASPETPRPATSLVRRARKINRVLAQTYPDARCELDFADPFQLLVATVLSAQTTDRRVNAITPTLFAAYPDAAALAGAERAAVEEIIRPTGFFRAKTESILGLAAALVERFDGEVPGRLPDLVSLPGVGRKTANVVLGNAFGVPGITADTHFMRLVRRWEWVDEATSKDPVSGLNFYVGEVQIEEAAVALGERRLLPGMPVEVFISTENRTALSYLLKPLMDHAERGFRER